MTAFAPCRFAAAKAASISLSVLAAMTQLPAECARRMLRSVPLVGNFRALRVDDQYGDFYVRDQFAQQLELLGSQFRIKPTNACDVPAGVAQASDEGNQHRVGTAREDDRDGCRQSFGRQGRVIASDSSEHCDLPPDQICG